MVMDNSIGVNRRFRDESLFMGKSLQAEGYGQGETGKQHAIAAALEHEGSEVIYQNDHGHWFAKEVGEGKDEKSQLSALSKIDKSQIKLHPTLNLDTRQNMHNAFISFKDDRAEFKAPDQLSDMSAWQKLKVGNTHAIGSIAHEGKVLLQNPLSAGANMAQGMVVNTWETLSNPQKSFASVANTYQQDKTEGVIQGVKVAGSVVASAALVVGIGLAVGQTGVKIGSIRTGQQLQAASLANQTELFSPLIKQAHRWAQAGQTLGHIGQVTGRIGKAASLTVLGATSLSLLKNEVDLARANTAEDMAREVKQITQDAGSLAQSAVTYAANKILTRLAEETKKLYTENRNYRSITPEAQALMDQFIDEQSQVIAQRVAQEVPEFSPETWASLSEADRVVALNKINHIFTEQMGKAFATGSPTQPKFQTPELRLEDMPEYSYGYYQPSDNSITLNRSRLGDLSGAGNTLTHEGFHALQKHMMDTYFDDPGHQSFGAAFDEHLDAWLDNELITGYASTDKNAGKSVLGIPVEKLPGIMKVDNYVVEDILFPGLDSYWEYSDQPVETGAWRMGEQFSEAYNTIQGISD